MRFQFGKQSAVRGNKHKGAPITAKGPQDSKAFPAEEFRSAAAFVSKASASGVALPQSLFAGVTLSESTNQDAVKRYLLASYTFFKADPNKSLSFYCRYMAMLRLVATADLSRWVVKTPNSEFIEFDQRVIDLAAKSPVLANGTFDSDAFLEELMVADSIPSDFGLLNSSAGCPQVQEPPRLAA